jgi:hypothetical protein
MKQGSFWSTLRRLWFVPFLMTLAALVAAGAAAVLSPAYVATASVVALVPSNGNVQVLGFADVATANTVAIRALSDTGVPESVDQLESELSVVATRSTLFKISVADAPPSRAVVLANAVATEAAALYTQLAGGASSLVLPELVQERATYQTDYLSATQALIAFNASYPVAVRANNSPALAAQRSQLGLEQQAAHDAYVSFETSTAQARVQHITGANDFSAMVVDHAVARSQTTSRILKVGFAGFIGLLLGLALMVVIERGRAARRGMSSAAAGPDDRELLELAAVSPNGSDGAVDLGGRSREPEAVTPK